MQRKREQSGTTVRIGSYWCVRYADWRIEDGVRIRRQGLTHKLTAVLEEHRRLKRAPKYVERLQGEFMETVNAATTRPEMCSTITQFVEGNWLPFTREQDSPSTVTTYTYYWTHLLKPRCGSKLLRDYTTPQAEQMLHEIWRHHPEMRKATLQKLRSILSGIFKRAIGQGCRTGHNPIREVTPPKGLPSRETYAYTLLEIRQILGAMTDEVTRLLIALAGYVGLSKSEIAGLTWEAYDLATGEIKVMSGVVSGKRGDPKTKARKASVPLIPSVRELLDLYRLRLGNPTTGVMFATEVGTPIDLKNIFTRRIDPILNACAECGETRKKHRLADHEYRRREGLVEWHGWHAFRRGLGSNLNDLGVLDLTIQKILRHSNVATTRKSYIHHREHQLTAAMEQLAAGIEAESRKAEAERSEVANRTAETVN
jgi:integrase